MSQPTPPQFTDPKTAKAQAKAEKAYRKASRPFYKKKRFILLAVIALIVVIIIATTAGGGGDSSSSSAANDNSQSGTGSDGAPAFPGAQEGDRVAQAGEQIDLDGVVTTTTPLVEGQQLGTTPVLCTTVSIQNNSDESANFNGGFDWKLQDSNGAARMTTLGGSDNLLSAGDLAPGGTVSGDVCFDVPELVPGQYVVLYEPSFSFSSDRAAWINNR
jgi:hypothetical protein